MLIENLDLFLLCPFQTFPAKDGWPFPSYMGACGRFVAEEYSGRTLSYFHTFQFNTRAALAVQVKQMTNLLTSLVQFSLFFITIHTHP